MIVEYLNREKVSLALEDLKFTFNLCTGATLTTRMHVRGLAEPAQDIEIAKLTSKIAMGFGHLTSLPLNDINYKEYLR